MPSRTLVGSGQPLLGSDRVTLCAVDCVNPLHALQALDICLSKMAFADAVFLSDTAADYVLEGCRMVTIPRLESAEDYSRFVIKELGPHIQTSHALLVQWDGYILDPAAWRAEFLDYDYIGAPWGWYKDDHRVGNGGFSLRSRKLLVALQDADFVDCHPEDEAIGRRYRTLLEARHDIRFAPEAVAEGFSFETTYPSGPTFGFHGLFNMWMALQANDLAAFVGALDRGVITGPQYLQLSRNYRDAGRLAEALVVLSRRVELDPGDAQAAGLLSAWRSEAVRSPIVPAGRVPGRNEPCLCGSGKRYKACCGSIPATTAATPGSATGLVRGALTTIPTAFPARSELQAILDRAMALHQAGNLVEAEGLYRQVLAIDSDNFAAIQYLGVLALQKGDAVAAEALVRRALAQKEDIPEFHSNLGLCLRAQGRLEEAVTAYRRAIWLRPDYAAAYNNLGLDLQALGRVDHAVAAFEDAIAHAPDLAEAHWNLGLALLLQGRLERGWAEYEWRLRCQPFERHRLVLPGAKPWQGEPLAGRSLLVRQEQGAGDTIQFLRLVPSLTALGARVAVEAAPSLARLVGAALPGVQVVAPGEAPAADFYVNLLSLPARLGVRLDTLPSRVPYLRLEPGWGSAIEAGQALGTALRIGIVWSGNPAHANDRNRSCPPELLEPMLAVPGCHWFSLQKGGVPMPEAWSGRVRDLGSSFGDFAETAIAVDSLDLIIAVDTSVAHIAGALAKPVWIMLPFAPDWRWLLGRSDSPWYPTARLFRQPAIGDWPSLVADVVKALRTQASQAASGRR